MVTGNEDAEHAQEAMPTGNEVDAHALQSDPAEEDAERARAAQTQHKVLFQAEQEAEAESLALLRRLDLLSLQSHLACYFGRVFHARTGYK